MTIEWEQEAAASTDYGVRLRLCGVLVEVIGDALASQLRTRLEESSTWLRMGVTTATLASVVASGALLSAVPADAQENVYTVQSGDTLSTIAQKIYGNPAFWTVLYDANSGLIGNDPNVIQAGIVLNVPSGGGPAPVRPGFYTVQPGDTLGAIAQAQYGNSGYWTLIYNANTGVIGNDPRLIYPGQVLAIPPVSGVTPTTPTTPTTPPTGGSIGLYTVQSGDTLSAIAQYIYGNGSLWPTIYAANQNTISNPTFIYPGQVLTIPR